MTGRPRVLVVTPDFPPAKGGIQVLSHRIVSSLRDLDPTVVTLGQAGAAPFDLEQRFRVIRVSNSLGPRALVISALNATAMLLAYRQRPDVVLSTHIVAAPAAALIRHRLGIPFAQYVHAKEIGAKPGLARFALARADRTIAVSRYTRDLALNAGAPLHRIALVHPGVDVPEAGRSRDGDASRPTILTIARLEDRYKGHDVVLRALPLVRAKIPQARWRVIGGGPLRPTLEDRARTLGVDGMVDFLGPVSNEERDRELDSADAFCMVSRLPAGHFAGEGFGIVYLEANAHGLPVVAGAVGGATDAVVDGRTGLLVDPEDPAAVADALVTLLSDRALALRMGDAGRRRAEMMSWDAAARLVESELLQLIA